MRKLYASVSQSFSFGNLAKSLKRNSQKLRTVIAVMAMMVVSAPFYGQTWNLVDIADLTSTDVFMIVDTASGNAMTNDNGTGNPPACFSLTFNADNSQVTTATIPDNVKWNISGDATDGYTFYPNGTTETWLYCTNSNNGVRVGTNANDKFTLSSNWLLNSATSRYVGVYNGQDWRCYTSSTGNNAATRTAFYKYTADLSVVATPTFSPEAGTYNGTQNITIACATEGATIRYTLDGTDPTDASTEYTAAIEVSANTTIKAKAWKNGLTASAVATAEYVITNYTPLDAPIFSPIAGTYTGAQQITISAVDGATIRYTLDGTDPIETSTEYTGAITITSSKTIKAKAWMDGYLPSEVASAEYVIELPVLTFNKLASHTQITTNDIYMIVDTTSGRALTSANGSTSAPTAVAVTIENNAITAAVPYELQWKFAEEEGGYSIYPATNNEVWLYTTGSNNGVRVGTNANKVWELNITDADAENYLGLKNVATSRYLGVYNNQDWRAYAAGSSTTISSNIQNCHIEFFILGEAPEPAPAEPVFSHPAGTYTNSVDVTLSCETEGATIYYTLDGNDPTNASTEYTDAIHITQTTTVKAIAIKNAQSSAIVSATYTITNMEVVATPVITPEEGNYNEPQQITITCATDEALIYYTTDGTNPTTASTLYEGPFSLSVSAIVKAIAVKEGYTDSGMASAAYTMPVFLENLAAVYSTAANDQYRVLGDVTFVFRSGRYMFVKDATAGMMIFDNNTPIITTQYEEGDVISGGISGKTSIYNGLYELVPTANTAVSTSNTGAIVPSIVTIPQMSNGNEMMSQLVTVQNLTVTGISGQNIIVSDGENTIKIYDRFSVITESDYAADDILTSVTGFVSKFNSDYQIFPRTAADIVKREVPAEPTFTPDAGTYTASVTVTLACETEGATIYYNLNDTDAQMTYTEPLTFTDTTTIHAFAELNGVRSQTVSATYSITDMEIVATPTIEPNGGTFEDTQVVTLSCETVDALIYYTLNGENPTEASILYENPFTLDATTIVKAIAVKAGMAQSTIAEATFTKTEPVVAVNYTRITSLDQLQDGDKVIIASRYDADATHYYVAPTRIANNRFNGVAVTTENEIISTDVDSVVWTVMIADDTYKFVNASNDTLGYGNNGTNFVSATKKEWTVIEYTAPEAALVGAYAGYKITNATTTNRCVAFRRYADNNDPEIIHVIFAAYADGNASNEEYNFALDIFVDASEHAPMVARPTITPNGGEFETTVDVTLACATEGAAIYYTLNGETPTTESTLYVEPFTLDETATVKAFAVKEEMDNSAIAVATFTKVVPTAATPTINPNGGTFETSIEVTLACETEDADIYYTLDGTDPTAESTLYEEAFTLDETTTVKAIAVKEGLANSAVAEATFTKVEPPVVVNYTRITSLDQLQDGAKLIIASRYDDDETHYYVAPTRITNKLNGVAVTVDNNIISTDVDTIVWTVSIEGDNYRFVNANDANLGYGSSTNFSSSQNPDWNVAEFTAQGLVDNCSGYKITNVSTLNESSVRAVAFKSGTNVFGAYATSNANGDEYNFALDFFVDLGDNVPTVATPVFTPAAGYYEEAQNVTITCATEGATIYYTTDGTVPTNESTLYTEPIAVSQNTTIKAIAYVDDEFSFVATARYTFPNFVENIAALYEVENTAETYVLTGDVTFVFRNGKSIYVKDATGGLLIFDQSNVVTTEYTEGDVISGGITGTISMYHGMLEFVPTFNTAAATQNTGAVAPTVITVEQLLTNNYVSQLVKVENVAIAEGTTYTECQTGDNVTFSQNGNEAILRNGFKTLDMEIGDNTNWDIIGFAAIYDENVQIYPRSNDDVTIVTSVEDFASEIAIYPNPTSDIVNIVTNGNAQHVEIANVDGQIVSSEAVSSDVVTVSLEAQPAGMYFVRIYTTNEVIVSKVTKF